MSNQFDYLREQISGNIWAGKEILQIADAVGEGIGGGQEWFMNLPHIRFIMENPAASGIKDVIVSSQDLAGTVVDCNLVFLETVHGVNRAFNSKIHKNLAGTGQSELAKLSLNNNEKTIYEASVSAHNETLNLPKLSTDFESVQVSIEQTGKSATEQIDEWKAQAIQKVGQLKDELTGMLEGLKGNPRRNVQSRIKIAERSLTAMGKKTPTAPPEVIGASDYIINSIYSRSITSIHSRPPVLNAIVPIAVGGAATVAGAASVITGIATWLLGSFFLKAFNIPAVLLPALTNTVTSIVLKVTGSAGANAVRFLAGSALKAGSQLLPIIMGAAGMEASGWAYLMAWAMPIVAASVIIIQAMRNRLALAEMLYIFGDLTANPNRFNFVQAYMSDTNKIEILEEFKTSAKEMKQGARLAMNQIIGVGLDSKKKYAVCYNLTNPDNPIQIVGKEAIETVLGADKVARIATGRLGFMDFI